MRNVVGSIDLALIALYAFWIFFAGLIFYLRREDKREGYPLVSDRGARVMVQGFPAMPPPKAFRLADGSTVQVPRREEEPSLAARPVAGFPGAPLQPTGDPMQDGVGPAAYAMRHDVPDMMFDAPVPKIVPLRTAPEYSIEREDPDPRGMTVYGFDHNAGGTVVDGWIDRSDMALRYLEVEVASATGPRHVLVPMPLVRIDHRRRRVNLASVTAAQLAAAPATREPTQITLREEDRIAAYFASGHLYATPGRLGPVL
ncbi:photosynthetic reaction center subunit H [Roseomonas sp. CAU 1739]|uniref:photosynthetic reaction center subunit H n=1 Tax=Roseomonas sp. CAU 1739 TaxID=3140364 RepID=UPI00325B5992